MNRPGMLRRLNRTGIGQASHAEEPMSRLGFVFEDEQYGRVGTLGKLSSTGRLGMLRMMSRMCSTVWAGWAC